MTNTIATEVLKGHIYDGKSHKSAIHRMGNKTISVR